MSSVQRHPVSHDSSHWCLVWSNFLTNRKKNQITIWWRWYY
ncbi:unnamed protein product [Arabidopsis halleri]